MRLLVDMNLSPALAEYLHRHGHDALHWLDVGEPNAGDDEILSFAADQQRVIVTSDLDFGTMLILDQLDKPSILQLRTDISLAARIGPLVADAIAEAGPHLDDGAIVTIEPTRLRVRRLRNDL